MRFLTCLLMAFALDALFAAHALAGMRWRPRIFGTDRVAPMAGATVQAERVGTGDTLRLSYTLGSDLPLSNVRWEVVIPSGLALISGEVGGTELTRGSNMNWRHPEARVRCERWGDFKIAYSIRAAQDSANWASCEGAVLVHATPESLTCRVSGPDFLERTVVDGVHYRNYVARLIPLDPGEDERVGPEVLSNASIEAAPAIHRESAVRPAGAAVDSTAEVPVWVVIDRAGRVKAVDPATGPAAEAARKWTFEPAMSLGRPVTMLYLIRVPVRNTRE